MLFFLGNSNNKVPNLRIIQIMILKSNSGLSGFDKVEKFLQDKKIIGVESSKKLKSLMYKMNVHFWLSHNISNFNKNQY
ncbi:hypothetical protein BpHYR1_021552 [Brachionus plicatilis]|uniref:Uncharacterized protein n=1 Tax=Brachionus plicatilis TaxID=10195 RepID=A0A3M7SXQ2_BRAPC|nr:hypothetical protein BpHYR1_021552 [Brachionus plicatilis]